VTVRLRRQDISRVGRVLTDPDRVADGLCVFLRHSRSYQSAWSVPLDAENNPCSHEDLVRLAERLVLIQLLPRQPANMIGEAIGLSATLPLGVLLFAQLEPRVGALAVGFLGVLAGSCLEGGVVGTAQRLVLRRPLVRLTWTSWVAATAIGAGSRGRSVSLPAP
jgi:hypothetical protein